MVCVPRSHRSAAAAVWSCPGAVRVGRCVLGAFAVSSVPLVGSHRWRKLLLGHWATLYTYCCPYPPSTQRLVLSGCRRGPSGSHKTDVSQQVTCPASLEKVERRVITWRLMYVSETSLLFSFHGRKRVSKRADVCIVSDELWTFIL